MEHNRNRQKTFNQLHSQIKRRMMSPRPTALPLTAGNPLQLLKQLKPFQLEPELQNEALHRSRQELMQSKIQYTELYDTSPIGYLTLENTGLIRNANLTFAAMLSRQRSSLINQRVSDYITPDGREPFNRT